MPRPTRRTASAVLLALLVALAGCGAGSTATDTGTASPDRTGGPTGTATPAPTTASTATPTVTSTPTATPAEAGATVEVTAGSLPVNATTVWRRVTGLTGSAAAPGTVRADDLGALGRQAGRSQLQFLDELGVDQPARPVESLNRSLGALTTKSGTGAVRTSVYVGENVSDSAVECLLAHEFGHVVQFRAGHATTLRRALRRGEHPARGLDRAMLYRSLLEAGGMAVQRAYADEYGCAGASPYEHWVENGTAWEQQVAAPYYYGERYAAATLDSPTNLSALVTDPLTTTEQLLHPGTEEPPAPLSVTVDARADDWTELSRLRMGELMTRVSLTAGLSDRRAAAAAAGWGNDTVVRFRNGSDSGWVWVTRWDDAANASQFETAFADYLDARGERDGDRWAVDDRTWRLVRTGEGSVAVVVGTGAFVDAVSVSGGRDVTVVVGNASAGPAAVVAGASRRPRGDAPGGPTAAPAR